jgi:polysaccharide export outer membrane protein
LTRTLSHVLGIFLVAGLAAGCAARPDISSAPTAQETDEAPFYKIGPGDNLEVFVWRNPELTKTVVVRPDGRVTVPLVEDLEASGKTPTELARDVENELSAFVQDPFVSVFVSGFSGTFDQQVRVVGQAAEPQAMPYRDGMTVLDVMINVGGLTQFADGDGATLVRRTAEGTQSYRIRLDDLLNDGDINANAPVRPGDVIIIPETFL